MKITQVAVLLIRIVGIMFFVHAAVVFIDIPTMVSNIYESQTEQTKILAHHEFILLVGEFAKFCIYLVAAICFLVLARPFAKLFTKGLVE
jgi:hypothetical protein